MESISAITKLFEENKVSPSAESIEGEDDVVAEQQTGKEVVIDLIKLRANLASNSQEDLSLEAFDKFFEKQLAQS